MTPVFVDTSAWYAITDRTDTDHPSAAATLKRLASARARLVTTGHVLAELHRLTLHRSHRQAAAEAVRRIIGAPRVDLVHADAADLDAALAWIDRFADQAFTLTDALGFAVMDRLGIRRAFAYDADFSVAGFELIALSRRRSHVPARGPERSGTDTSGLETSQCPPSSTSAQIRGESCP